MSSRQSGAELAEPALLATAAVQSPAAAQGMC